MKHKFDIKPFVELGRRLRADLETGFNGDVIAEACIQNRWFTPQSVRYSIKAICDVMLCESTLNQWLDRYMVPPVLEPKRVGVIMAGNIPAAGFFDLLCVLLCGRRCVVKPSSKDRVLIDYIVSLLHDIDPDIGIEYVCDDDILDAVIATGGDAASIVFRTKYAHLPSIIRSDRRSVAVLNGDEMEDELKELSNDMFTYFGLGCRNVTHIWAPKGYDMERLVIALSRYDMDNKHFRNDYRHLRALLMMQEQHFYDGGFFVMTQGSVPSSHLSCITYMYYDNLDDVRAYLLSQEDNIQCVVSLEDVFCRGVGFSEAQKPKPWDYPDGVDVVEFLLSL